MAWDSWPRCFSSPKEYDQAGVSLNTLSALTCLSGLQRWAWVPHAVLQHVAGGLVVVGDVLPGHILGQRGASAAQGDGEGEAVQARAQEAGRGG